MKLYKFVTKDIMRRKRRVLYATLGVVIGTMTVVDILTIAVAGQARITNQLEKYGANLTIIPAISSVDMKLGNLSMGTLSVGENYIQEEKLPQVRQIADGEIKKALGIEDDSEIATLSPKLYVSTNIKQVSAMAVGVDPEAEKKIKTWWKIREGAWLENPNEAVVGATSAELLQIKKGDTIPLNGTDLTVVGILEETGSTDDYQIFVPLPTLQKAFNKVGMLSSIDVRALCNACPVDIIANSINQTIPGVRAVAVKQVAESEMGVLDRMNTFMLALAGITLLVGLFGVVNTMMTSVHERIKDIGIMRAVGASRNQIVKVFIYEAVIIGLLGGIFGYVVGTLIAYGVAPLIFEGTTVAWVPQYLPVSFALATCVSIVATVYPALRAAKIKVADSFRSL